MGDKFNKIRALNKIAKTKRGKFHIEVTDISDIGSGVEVFVRAWKGGKQIGFGKDGSVELERFRIFNPPTLVPDVNGTIKRTVTDIKGAAHTASFREDHQEALLQVIAHNLSVMKNIHGAENIQKGKRGSTTSTFYPDANPESTSVDGYVARTGVDETFSTIRGGAGTTANDSDNDEGYATLIASTTSNQYAQMFRSIVLFDTSSIPDGDTISSATISFYGNFKFNGLGSTNLEMDVTASTPAANTSLVAADYQQLGSTSFGSVSYASYSTTGYNDITLNSSGLADISKTRVMPP